MSIFQECGNADHPLARIDARVKLVFVLALLVLTLSNRGFFFITLVLGFSAACCAFLRIPLRRLAIRFSEPLFIAGMLVLLKCLYSGQKELFTHSAFGLTIAVHSDGLRDGLLIAGRIMATVSLVALLGFSTTVTNLMSALAWFRVPRTFIEIFMLSFRYIFVLFEDAEGIYQAQKNRLGYSTIRRGLGSFGVLAGSLVLKAFDRSHAVTVAMVQRGYDGTMPVLNQRPVRTAEVVGLLLGIGMFGVLWKLL